MATSEPLGPSPPSEDVKKGPAINEQKSMLDLSKKLRQSSLEEAEPYDFIDSCPAITKPIDSLVDLQGNTPSLYIDLEGLLNPPQKRTYLIDIHILGSDAFSTAGESGQTLKTILESETIPKAIFDVRNDSDTLYSHFGISLAGVYDIQVMEFATRQIKGKYIDGLSKCIKMDLVLTKAEREPWLTTKEKGLNLFAPERDGSYELFNARPLTKILCEYCTQDVQYLPRLWSTYWSKLGPSMWARVKQVSDDRVKSSQSRNYDLHGKNRALGPW